MDERSDLNALNGEGKSRLAEWESAADVGADDPVIQYREDLERRYADLSAHVQSMWPILTRGQENWFLGALEDPKVPHTPGDPFILYVPETEDIERVKMEAFVAQQRVMQDLIAGHPVMRVSGGKIEPASLETLPNVDIRTLPYDEHGHLNIPVDQHGLLYLPHRYVVPGVRFNEMYNWDTAFVVRGLIHSEEIERAKELVDNMLYEIDHYDSTILNGNRTYYLPKKKEQKPRSQPPLITAKVLAVYHHYDKLQNPDMDKVTWLKQAATLCEQYYQHWVTPPHLHEESGLSMYNSDDPSPGEEVLYSEPTHYAEAYRKLLEMYERQKRVDEEGATPEYQDRKDRYYIEQFLEMDEWGRPKGLSEAFYRGDRAMRESGFDPSRLFGFFNVDIINYLPVSLNCLRYKMEKELSDIFSCLAEAEPNNPEWQDKDAMWAKRSLSTGEMIQDWLYDDGLDENDQKVRYASFRDLNVNDELLKKHNIEPFRDYDYATAFFPMWVGVASQEQADEIVKNLLPRLMTPYGLMTSARETGSQWDAPLIWAPLQVIAMEALERYGYYEEAKAIGEAFLAMVDREYKRTGHVYEKYEGRTGTANTEGFIDKGYSTNDIGFAWTNSSILDIKKALVRLEYKIRGRDLGHPDITHNFFSRKPNGAHPPELEHGDPVPA
ncbi:MAG: hypothetical protein KDI65_05965 [Alphaproteobacteria bacterium]|nr:hypothetical protein [Alphaproteobacteria bacterium]